MRRKYLFLSFTLASLMIILSCSKENVDSSLPVNNQGDSQLVKQLQWFMNAASEFKEGKILKSDEKMYLDSAVLYISSTLNYKYGYQTEQFGKLRLDTFNVTIPILGTEEKAYIVDALSGYNQIVERIRNKYEQITGENKKLICCVVQEGGVNRRVDSTTIRVITQVGTGRAETNPILNRLIPQTSTGQVGSNATFGADDAYWWQRDSWMCDGTGDEGAPNVFDNMINFAWKPATPPNYRVFYTSISANLFDNPLLYPNPNGGPTDNFCDYQLFLASSLNETGGVLTDETKCLGEDPLHPGINEMDFYLHGLESVLGDYLRTNQKDFLTLYSYSEDNIVNYPTFKEEIKNVSLLTFGIRHMIHINPDPQQNYPISIME